jgi:hypothetical protein
VAERHPLGGRVVLQHDDVDLIVDLEELRRMTDTSPGHIRNVQEPVDAAEIDECAVIRDVLDGALEDLALGEGMQRVLLLFRVFLLEENFAG